MIDEIPRIEVPGLVVEGDDEAWAVFSTDRRYRYLLGRRWGDDSRPLAVFGMLNPSKAGAYDGKGNVENDPTVRKCIGFAMRLGCAGIVVANAGAFIATHPTDLAKVEDPVGFWNGEAIRHAFVRENAIKIAAWGRIAARVRARLTPSIDWMKACGATSCLGMTTNEPREPRHPLMLAYATPLGVLP